ncbi:hypothetical protein [Bacillus cereus]|nr:hypothetical protein [Bacillus cereus]
MKSKNSKFLASVCVSSALLVSATYPSITAVAAEVTSAKTAALSVEKANIINNKKGETDTITVSELKKGDIVRVYEASKGGEAIATSEAVAEGKVEVTITKKDLLKATGGTVYVSVQSESELESTRTAMKYESEVTVAPAVDTVKVANNKAGDADTITVSELAPGDIVKIYDASTGGNLKATSAAVAEGKKEATITGKDLLVSTGGTVYVTVTKPNKDESKRVTVKYEAEPTTVAPAVEKITVSNNKVGNADAITVSELKKGDIVRVYEASKGGEAIVTSEAVAEGKTEATILGKDLLKVTGGTVYVSVQSENELESARTAVKYESQVTVAPAVDTVKVANNKAGDADTITVSEVTEGDVVKVYDASTEGKELGNATVAKDAKEATITGKDLLVSTGGTVYVTVTKPNKDESKRVAVKYEAEPTTVAPAVEKITVSNNKVEAEDTITVSELKKGDIVRVYEASKGGEAIVTSEAVAEGKTEATILGKDLLKVTGGTVYVSVQSENELESARTAVKYESQVTVAPAVDTVKVVNNKAGDADTITVSEVTEGDVVKVYDASTEGKELGNATVAKDAKEATITGKDLLVSTGGTVYVTVTKPNKDESKRVAVKYEAEPTTVAPAVEKITVSNNKVEAEDTITVSELKKGDIVRVYEASKGGEAIVTSEAVAEGKTEATILGKDLLKVTGGTVYVSVQSENELESARTAVKYESQVTVAPAVDTVKVANNKAGDADTITVSEVTEGDVVKVYDASTEGKELGNATVAKDAKEATITGKDLLVSTGGTVYVTVTKPNKDESKRVAVKYEAEPTTVAPAVEKITVSNNKVGNADAITVSELKKGDIVRVYEASKGGEAIVTSEAVAEGKTEATILGKDLLKVTGGTVYVSVQSENELESARTAVKYESQVTVAPAVDTVKVANNKAGDADTITVSEVTEGDVVKVYDASTEGKELGNATVAKDAKEATITGKDLLVSTGGTVYVTVTKPNKDESKRVTVKYEAEPTTVAPAVEKITVSNNKVGNADAITVSELKKGDIVRVYEASKGGEAIVTSEAVAEGKTEATILGKDLLKVTGGTVYVSVQSENELESARTAVKYESQVTVAPAVDTVKVANNKAGDADTITVSEVTEGDVVKVYDASTEGKELGNATVAKDAKEATITGKDLLVSTGGTVYVTVTKPNKDESKRVAVKYEAEPTTVAPAVEKITVSNNKVEAEDTITVSELKKGDIVRVYEASKGGEAIVTSEAVAEGKTEATILGKDLLKVTGGTVYVSVQSENELESARTAVKYESQVTVAPAVDTVKVANNKAGDADTITVSEVTEGDVVKVYDASTEGKELGNATVAKDAKEATITGKDLLVSTGGTVYVTVTKPNKDESKRVAVKYEAEPTTVAPAVEKITVSNNKVEAEDTITVSELKKGDIVRVYEASKGGEAIVTSEAVAEGKTEATILGKDLLKVTGGTVYVSVQSENELESARTAVKYESQVTVAPAVDTVKVANNKAGDADTITVSEVTEGDVVKVYDASTEGKELGNATVAKDAKEATITGKDLLVSTGGTVYVTVTKPNKDESKRVAVKYEAEPTTVAPAVEKITVSNNKVEAEDTITVSELKKGDIVRVYEASKGGEAIVTSEAVAEGKTEATILGKDLLKVTGGTVYVSVQSENELESARTAVKYESQVTVAPAVDTVKVANNKAGDADTITVSEVTEGDVVKVYDASTEGKELGNATVAKDAKEATITGKDLLVSTGGTVYVTVTKPNKDESKRVAVKYEAEPTTVAPAVEKITVSNNKVEAEDTITVSELKKGDIVRVYEASKGGEAIVTSEAVAEGKTEATILGKDLLKVTGGTVYVSVQSENELESARTAVKYESQVTAEPVGGNIVVLNNDGAADIVRVTGLTAGDKVSVYNEETVQEAIGTATVAENKTAVNVVIPQLGEVAGKIYVSVTKVNKDESKRVAINYIAE